MEHYNRSPFEEEFRYRSDRPPARIFRGSKGARIEMAFGRPARAVFAVALQ